MRLNKTAEIIISSVIVFKIISSVIIVKIITTFACYRIDLSFVTTSNMRRRYHTSARNIHQFYVLYLSDFKRAMVMILALRFIFM